MERVVRLRNKRVQASIEEIPKDIRSAVFLLASEIEKLGPVRGNWPNYGKLGAKGVHHCHLKKGKPTYVAIWKEEKREGKLFVYFEYVGTHEGANYNLYK